MRWCMASTIHSGWGKKASSISCAGVIQFFAPTTTGGASRSSKQSSAMLEARLRIKLLRSQASPVTTMRPVFLTDSITIE